MNYTHYPTRIALCSLLATTLFSQTLFPVSPGPELFPDRVILTWAADPASTMAVTWRTSIEAGKPLLEWAVADDGPLFVKNTRRVAGVSQKLSSDSGDAQYHSVQLTALEPATLYVYRVGDGTYWSEWQHFRTAARKPDPLTFIYFGDAQHELMSMWPRVIRMAYRHAPDASFLIHAGDLINNRSGAQDAEWGQWFRAAGWLLGTVPSIPAAGNHEYPRRGTLPKVITPHWRAQFTLPENGVLGLEESNYFLDIQGVRIISLNSSEKQSEQAAWLDHVLTKNPQKWTVLAFHHPLHSSMKGQDNKELREMWEPVIDKHKVDLVFQGDEHSYARSNLVTSRDVRSGHTIYVVSVGGPQMYEVATKPWMHKSAEDTQLFQVIRVDGDRLAFESRTARGELYDSFVLHKGKGGNKLVNGKGMPERRRTNTTPPSASR